MSIAIRIRGNLSLRIVVMHGLRFFLGIASFYTARCFAPCFRPAAGFSGVVNSSFKKKNRMRAGFMCNL